CDVFGMELKDATLMTRIITEMNSEADSAAYWTPALPFRCLQYLNSKCVEELGLYRVSGSTSVVDELRNFFADCKSPIVFCYIEYILTKYQIMMWTSARHLPMMCM